MFNGCNSIDLINISNIEFDSKTISMNNMFHGCTSINSMNIFNLKIQRSNHNLKNMFSNCTFLGQLNIFDFQIDGSPVFLYMDNFFNNCTFFDQINIFDFKIDGSPGFLYMNNFFNSCTFLNHVNIFDFKIDGSPGYLYMDNFFNSCTFLNQVNILNFQFINSNNYLMMNNMFNFSSLTSVYFLNVDFKIRNNPNSKVFSGVKNLNYIKFNSCNINDYYYSFFFSDDIPENIVYCIEEDNKLYELLSHKNCSLLDCTDNFEENQKKKIIFNSNTCIDNCEDYSLVEYKNICYDNCPIRTYKDGLICKECFPSCEICQMQGNENEHNCISCEKGYNLIYYKEKNSLNCYKYYKSNKYSKSKRYIIYENECPIGYELISGLLFCIDNCLNQFRNQSEYNNDCFDDCKSKNNDCDIIFSKEFISEFVTLQDYNKTCDFLDNIYKLCVFNNEESYKKEKLFNQILYKLENTIFNDSNFYENKYIILEEQDYRIIVTSNKNQYYSNYLNNLKYIECENNLKNEYQLPDNAFLYLLILITTSYENDELLSTYESYFFSNKYKLQYSCNFKLKQKIINCPKQYLYILTKSNKCVNLCSFLDRYNKICIPNYFNNETNMSYVYEIQNNFLENIKFEITSGNFNTKDLENGKDIIITEEDIIITLTTNENQKNNINNSNVTIINLGECETELKEVYGLTGSIYILKIDKIIKGMKIPKIEYETYAFINSSKLEQLNMSFCEKYNIEILIPFNCSLDEKDLYDIKSGYYEDICYTNTTKDGIDISLRDRKNEFIQENMTLCEENCDLEGYDFKIRKAICSCSIKIKIPLFSEIRFDMDRLEDKFKNIKDISNISILKCYYLLLNIKGLIKNLGFCSMSLLFIFYIISIIVVCCKDRKDVNKNIKVIIYAKTKLKMFCKKHKNQNKINKANPIKGKNLNKLSPKKKIIEGTDKNNLKLPNLNLEAKGQSIGITNNLQLKNKNKKKKTNLFNSGNSNNSQSKMVDRISLNILNQKYIKIMQYTVSELNDLSYEKAIISDERTFCQFYLNLVSYSNLFLFAFCVKNDYNSRILKINLFFYSYIINYGLNALFFTEEIIHQIYIDNGVFNFIYQLPQILLSFLISLVLSKILTILSLFGNDIIELKKEKKIDIYLKSINIRKKIFTKLILFFIISFVILSFFWLYLSCFCIVYKNTQIYLLKDALISFGASFISPFFLNLLPGMFRIPALKSKNKEYLYKFSKIIQMLIE